MRPEKTYLVKEASDYLSKTDYFFLTDYKGINSEDTSTLRNKLSDRGAEALAQFPGERLNLSNLERVSENAARSLVKLLPQV